MQVDEEDNILREGALDIYKLVRDTRVSVDREDPVSSISPWISYGRQEEEERPSAGETVAAAFRDINLVNAAIEHIRRPSFEADQTFDLRESDLSGYELWLESFYKAESEEEVDFIKSKIDKEQETRAILQNSHGFLSFVSMVAAGVADPMILIPGGWILKGSVGAASTAGKMALLGAGVTVGSEAVLHSTQETRTFEESRDIAIAGTILSAALGGGLGAYVARQNRITPQMIEDATQELVSVLRYGDLTLEQRNAASKVINFNDDLSTQDSKLLADIIAAMTSGDKDKVKAAQRAYDEFLMTVAREANPGIESTASALVRGIQGESRAPAAVMAGAEPAAAAERTPLRSLTETTIEAETLVIEPFLKLMGRIGLLPPDSFALATSPNRLTRAVSQLISEDPWSRKKNHAGVAKSQAAYMRTQMEFNTLINEVAQPLDDGWAAYLRTVPANQRTITSFDEYSAAITLTALLDDTAYRGLPGIRDAALAMRRHLDKYGQLGRRLGMMTDEVPTGGLFYVPRSYRSDLIGANPNQFITDMATELQRSAAQSQARLPAAARVATDVAPDGRSWEQVASEIRESIMGLNGPYRSNVLMDATTNSLRSRKINIEFSERFMRDWLDLDVDRILVGYHQSVVPRLKLAEILDEHGLWKTGDFEGSVAGAYKLVSDEYTAMRAGASAKEIKRLDKAERNDIKLLKRTTDRLLSRHNNASSKATQAALSVSYQANLGGMMISSLPEVPRIILAHELGRVIGDIPKLFKDIGRQVQKGLDSGSISRTELEMFGAPGEIRYQTRVRSLAEISSVDDMIPNGFFMRQLKKSEQLFTKMSLQTHFNELFTNSAVRGFAGRIMSVSTGELPATPKRLKQFAQMGIDKPMLDRIGVMVRRHGGKDHLDRNTPNFNLWTDKEAAQHFQYALTKGGREIILRPDNARHPIFDTTIGKFVFQFKSFINMLWYKGLMANMQRFDLDVLGTWIGTLLMSGLVVKSREVLYGRPGSDSFNDFLRNTFDASGLGSVPWDMVVMTEDLQRLALGKSMPEFLFGNESPAQRYGGSQYAGNVQERIMMKTMGAFPGTVLPAMISTGRLLGDVLTGSDKISRSDLSTYRRLIPYQNIFYLRRLVDDFENAVGDFGGLRGRRKPGMITAEKGLLEPAMEGDLSNIRPFLNLE